MPEKRLGTAYEITWLVRRLFKAMAATADEYLAETEVSVAERAVMEFLYPREELSVPQIARRYRVSRQHVQVTVNGLIRKGLLRSIANPEHKRSPLIRLSSLGRDCFEEIRRNENRHVDELFADLADDALETTHATLRTLYERMR